MPDSVAWSIANRDAVRMNFAWLVRLRWGAIVGQIVVIAFIDRVMKVPLPLDALGIIVLGSAVVNLVSLLWARLAPVIHEAHLALAMGTDLLLFSAILYWTGGPSNPFSSLYLIHIALAAVVLPPRWSWALVLLALACSAGLFLDHHPLNHGRMHQHHGNGGFDWHLRGMWVALGLAASFIVYFLHRVTRALGERDRALALERERALRRERLASVATLATGAAHELSSPLGTIAIASGELEAELRRRPASEAALGDVVLIREQVARCRRILDQLAIESGQTAGEPLAALRPEELAELTLSDLAGRERVEVHAPTPNGMAVFGPPRALVQALRSLLENASYADPVGRIRLGFTFEPDTVRIEVVDRGVGMSQEILERATEPFFSTRASGSGMGLGLFLAQSVADQLGGRLELASEPGRGTRAALVLPASTAPEPALPAAPPRLEPQQLP